MWKARLDFCCHCTHWETIWKLTLLLDVVEFSLLPLDFWLLKDCPASLMLWRDLTRKRLSWLKLAEGKAPLLKVPLRGLDFKISLEVANRNTAVGAGIRWEENCTSWKWKGSSLQTWGQVEEHWFRSGWKLHVFLVETAQHSWLGSWSYCLPLQNRKPVMRL